jgi:hypothetical protein
MDNHEMVISTRRKDDRHIKKTLQYWLMPKYKKDIEDDNLVSEKWLALICRLSKEERGPTISEMELCPSKKCRDSLSKSDKEKLLALKINPTHVRMDGGKYYVKKDEEVSFWKSICRLWKETNNWPNHYHSHKSCLCLVELKTVPIFNMFFDLDILIYKPEWKEMILAASLENSISQKKDLFSELEEFIDKTNQKLYSIVKGCYPHTNIGNMTLCLSPIRDSGKKECLWKIGAHIIFPQLQVTFDIALLIREILLYTFITEYQERNIEQGENSWADVIDVSVYHNIKGLRSCGSCKSTKCKNKECKDTLNNKMSSQEKNRVDVVNVVQDSLDMNNCPNDCSLGTVYVHSIYWPYSVYSEKGRERINLDIHDHHVSEVLRTLTSIRSYKDEATQGFKKISQAPAPRLDKDKFTSDGSNKRVLYENFEEWLLSEENRLKIKKNYEKGKNDMIDTCQNHMIRNRETVILDFTPQECNRIQECIRDIMPDYNQIMLRKITAVVRKEGKKKTLIPRDEKMSRFECVYINVHGYGQHYCHNKGDEHGSNTIYFQIINKDLMKGYLYQRCFSHKSYNSKLCRNYVFPKDGEIIDEDVYLLLFPLEKTAVEKAIEKMPKDSPLIMNLGI